MKIEFTSHNIRLDNGTLTRPEIDSPMEYHPWFVSARRTLNTVFPGDKSHLRIADLGCLEGGYAVEFARMGFQVVGIEVRDANIAACNYVKANTNLPNLEFVKDDARNISAYGPFDAVFCCGLFYHVDQPKQFLETLASVTTKLLIIQTHFATAAEVPNDKFGLSALSEHEGLMGRWFTEYPDEAAFSQRETNKWAAWDSRRAFWVQREYLLQALQNAGFDLVMEQYDSLVPSITDSMLGGYYTTDRRGTFIGVKTAVG